MTTNEGLTKKLISKYLHIDDPELLQQSYLYCVENFAREPTVPPGAMQWMAQQLAQMNLVDAEAMRNYSPIRILRQQLRRRTEAIGIFRQSLEVTTGY